MNFDLTEDQELFKATAEKFVAPMDVEARRRLRSGDNSYDRARWTELAELGFLALAVDEKSGGIGGTMVDLTVLAEALGTGNAPDPWLENGAIPAMLLAAANRSKELERFMDGGAIGAFAFAERAQRFEINSPSVQAISAENGYVISGNKTFVMGGGLADFFIVTTAYQAGLALFIIPADAQGVEIRPYKIADGSTAAEVFLRNVSVAANDKLDIGICALNRAIARARLLAAAEMTGLGQRLLDETLDYVKQRQQFGVAIGSFQALQHRLVDCYCAMEQARSMLWRVCLADRGDRTGWEREVLGAKAFIAIKVMQIGREAVQMHGGMGVTDELMVGHALKRALLLEKLFGDTSYALQQHVKAA